MIDRLNPDYLRLPGLHAGASAYVLDGSVQSAPAVTVISFLVAEGDVEGMLDSLRRQTLQNWRWLLFCSDASQDVLRSLAAEDARVRPLLRGDVQTCAAALSQEGSNYFALLDPAVSWEATFLEKSLWCLVSNEEYSFCNSYSVVHGSCPQLSTLSLSEGRHYLSFDGRCRASLVIRREAMFAAAGTEPLSLLEGDESRLLAALVAVGAWGLTIAEFLQWCRSGAMGGALADCSRLPPAEAFPRPQRHQAQAYESLPEEFPFANPLRSVRAGRRVMFILPWMVEGGADRVSIELIEGLVAGGNEVTICNTLAADHRWEHLFAEHCADIFVLPNILAPRDYPRFLAYLIDSRGIDTVIVSGSTTGYQLLPYLRANCPRPAFLDLSHTEEPHWLNGGHPRFGVGYQDVLDMNIVTTAHLAGWMAERGGDPDRIRVMYTGIRSRPAELSSEERTALRQRFGIAPARLNLIFAGRMCDQKRPLLLAEILRGARDAGIDFDAVVIGDGELRSGFEALLAKHGLSERVRVLGARSHDEWLSLLAVSDVLLMPSAYEGISVALLESMAAGVVPVVARVGGQSELVEPEVGYLIPHGADEVARYVSALAELAGGPELLAGKARACRELIARDFTPEATRARFMAIIEEAQRIKRGASGLIVTRGLARELATLALEYKRLSDYLDVLYAGHCLTGGARDHIPPTGRETQLAYALARRLSRSKVVALALRSRLLTSVARKVLSYVG